jgi:hypothetical protein
MWTVILALTGLKYLPDTIETALFRSVGECGKASWYIFMAQLIYYMLPAAYVYAFIITPLSFGSEAVSDGLILIFNLAICLSFGYGWYALAGKIKGTTRT